MQSETTRPTRPTRPCAGCSAPVPFKDPQRRSWCDRCAPLAHELLTIERTARILHDKYGFTDAALAVDSALDSIREQLRTGIGPARDVARGAMTEAATKSEAQHRFATVFTIKCRLQELVCAEPDYDPRGFAFLWISEFGSAVAPVADVAAEWSDDELIGHFHAYMSAALEELAAHCICGHKVPHPQETGCVRRWCACGSAARARRAESDVARVRAMSIDDLLRAWPK